MKLTAVVLALSLLLAGCMTSGTYNGSSYSDRTRITTYTAPDYSLGQLEKTQRETYPTPVVKYYHKNGVVVYVRSGNGYIKTILRNK